MKNLAKNPFFCLSVVLIFVVAFEVVNLVRAQYAAPTAPPPGGQPASPLDTSSFGQVKTGNITVGSEGLNGVQLNKDGILYFGKVAGNNLTSGSAAIMFDGTDFKYSTSTLTQGGGWNKFGTGTGSATNFWTLTSNGIAFTGGSVTVDNSGLVTKFWGTGRTLGKIDGGKNFALVQKAQAVGPNVYPKMPCDYDPDILECSDPYPYSSSMGNYVVGQYYYDSYLNQATGKYLYKQFVLEARPNNAGNTSVLMVGGVKVEDNFYVKSGNSYSPLLLKGTLCGLFVPGGISLPCGNGGPGPSFNRACPAGYTNVKFGKGVIAIDDLEVCVKN